MYDMFSKHCSHILWFQVGELFTPDHRTLGSCLAQLVRCLLMYLSTRYKINIIPSTQVATFNDQSSSLQKCHSIPCCQNDSYSPSGNLLDTDRCLNSSCLAIASAWQKAILLFSTEKTPWTIVLIFQLFEFKEFMNFHLTCVTEVFSRSLAWPPSSYVTPWSASRWRSSQRFLFLRQGARP